MFSLPDSAKFIQKISLYPTAKRARHYFNINNFAEQASTLIDSIKRIDAFPQKRTAKVKKKRAQDM